jgi:rubrerythrin
MIKINRKRINEIEASRSKEDLQRHLQSAVELEHATIPPYLTAMYSLIPGTNEDIAALLRSIVIEEMLHMTIAANILVAIGGSPQINKPEFLVNYPGPLPMGIAEELIVPIKAFSKTLVHDVFMTIEEPEFPPARILLAAEQQQYATIGEFYGAMKQKIADLGDGVFVIGADRQVLSWFDSKLLFPIEDVQSASAAIDIVITQGEGRPGDPFESPGVPAHYYRFREIYQGSDYLGNPIPFDPAGVYPMIDNPTPCSYDPESQAAMLSTTFSYAYSSLLNALHHSFNGAPKTIETVIGLMYELRLQAQKLMATPIRSGSSVTAGPVFHYVTKQ